MHEDRARATQAMIDAVLTSAGTTEPALRQAIQTQASTLGGHSSDVPVEIPTELASYVAKVARYAYKVTDEDVEALLQTGYSEDALYEITVSAALGAGIMRLSCGLAALEEE